MRANRWNLGDVPGSTGKGGDEAEKARKSVQGVLISRLLLWASGAQSCWAPLGASEGHTSQLSHMRGKKPGNGYGGLLPWHLWPVVYILAKHDPVAGGSQAVGSGAGGNGALLASTAQTGQGANPGAVTY